MDTTDALQKNILDATLRVFDRKGLKDKFTQIMVVNTWNSNANKKCAATSIKKMPKKSMTVTVTGKLK